MWTPLRPVSVTGVTAMGDTRWVVPAPVLVGAVVGLAWAASLRVLMAEFAGPESTFDWFGTFEGVLLPGLDFTGLKEPFDFRHSYTYRSVSQTWRPPSIIRILRHAAC